MTGPRRLSLIGGAGLVIALYVLLAAGTLYGLDQLLAPVDTATWKQFGVIAGLVLAAEAALLTAFCTLYTLATQTRTAYDLADQNASLQERLERLKAENARETEFLKKSLDVKTKALNDLFVTSHRCYHTLEHLALGRYDAARVEDEERQFSDARAAAADLDAETNVLLTAFAQGVMNLRDAADDVRSHGARSKHEYEALWEKYGPELGRVIRDLRKRSMFNEET